MSKLHGLSEKNLTNLPLLSWKNSKLLPTHQASKKASWLKIWAVSAWQVGQVTCSCVVFYTEIYYLLFYHLLINLHCIFFKSYKSLKEIIGSDQLPIDQGHVLIYVCFLNSSLYI